MSGICEFVFFLQLREAINSREQVLLDKLVSLHQSKESILTGQLERLQIHKTRLESAVEQAKSSIQSPSDVNFLLSRQDIVSSLETNHESYSSVLEPEAQFLPEFTKGEEVRDLVVATVQGQTTRFSILSGILLGSRGQKLN